MNCNSICSKVTFSINSNNFMETNRPNCKERQLISKLKSKKISYENALEYFDQLSSLVWPYFLPRFEFFTQLNDTINIKTWQRHDKHWKANLQGLLAVQWYRTGGIKWQQPPTEPLKVFQKVIGKNKMR